MRAVVLRSFSAPIELTLDTVDIPPLHSGQVLVKMAAASINPSDLLFLGNQYGVKRTLPIVPGFEGSGTVVAAGGSLLGRWLVGKRIACRAPESGHGTWAEYLVCRADLCIPLKKNVSLEQGATLTVNPLTAWALLELARRERHRAIVQTAAASAVGKMIARLARRYRIEVIHIVRRREQVEGLKSQGCAYVLDSRQSGFSAQLKMLSGRLDATLAFDAVGGELTALLGSQMPRGSRIVVYGALSGDDCQINPLDLIYQGKSLTGFWLNQWIKPMSWAAKFRMTSRVQNLLAGELATPVQARYPLEKTKEAIDFYKSHRSEGKVLLVME